MVQSRSHATTSKSYQLAAERRGWTVDRPTWAYFGSWHSIPVEHVKQSSSYIGMARSGDSSHQ